MNLANSTSPSDLAIVLRAASFAATWHRDDRRKDASRTPYINHPLEVARVLAEHAGVRDPAILISALLHDTLEDTPCTLADIETAFGSVVAGYVAEVTDDKTLSQENRKRRQIETGPMKSDGAKLIKLADKICNCRDVAHAAPVDWSADRRLRYLEWASEVAHAVRGVSAPLDRLFAQEVVAGRAAMRGATVSQAT